MLPSCPRHRTDLRDAALRGTGDGAKALDVFGKVRFLNVIATRGPRSIFPVVSFAIPGPQVSIQGIFEYIDATRSSTALRESLYVFPIVEGLHVVSLAFSVGLVMWFDLRLAGWILKDQPVSAVFRPLRPFMLTGFAITVVTGSLLFWSLATRCYGSPFFWAKALMLVLAGVNIAVYHLTIERRQAEWNAARIPPRQARIAGLASLTLWVGIIAAGRMMAYFL
jgi:hypothetical protein